MKPYVYRGSGEVHGEVAPAVSSPLPPPPRATLAERARAARRLAAQDPKWKQRSDASRRLLVNLALREERR